MTIPSLSSGRRPRGERLLVLGAAILALAVAGIYLVFGLLTASYTFACDFFAYAGAADRLVAGLDVYDLRMTSTGECGIYQYPPPFVLLALPFALLDPVTGALAWITLLVVCYAVAIAVMPVRPEVRWAVGLMGALSWPFIFGVRIGQVGPILLLLASLGWRWLDRPERVGVTTGLGVLVKLQPAVIGLWLVARGHWRAVAVAAIVGLAGAGLAALVGLTAWIEFVTLVRQLSDAVTVPANLSLGATAVKLGATSEAAAIVQAAGAAAVLAAVVIAARRTSGEAGYLVAVVASQLVSPIVWDHYALSLLLPVAYLLSRRLWWSAAIPVSMAWVLLPFVPTLIYPLAYAVSMVTLLLVGWQRNPAAARTVVQQA